MQLQIIRLFKNRNVRLSAYALYASSEPEEYDRAEKSEQKFDESIAERVKLRRQKADDKTDDEQLDTTDMPDLETEESVA